MDRVVGGVVDRCLDVRARHALGYGVCNSLSSFCAVGDVDGDGNADAVTFVKSAYTDARQGDVMVALAAKMAPAVLNQPVVSGTQVRLAWTDRSVSEDRFQILRRTGPADPLRSVGDVATRGRGTVGDGYTFTDTIPANTRACYDIRGYNSRGGQTYSNEMCTDARPLPTTPATGQGVRSDIAGAEPAMTIGRDGLGLISYYTPGSGAAAAPRTTRPCVGCGLAVAHCDNATCSTSTSRPVAVSNVASAMGTGSSIGIGGDGLPLVAYSVAPNQLWMAHCSDATCSNPATVTRLDTAARVAGNMVLSIGPDGRGTIAYSDWLRGRSELTAGK